MMGASARSIEASAGRTFLVYFDQGSGRRARFAGRVEDVGCGTLKRFESAAELVEVVKRLVRRSERTGHSRRPAEPQPGA